MGGVDQAGAMSEPLGEDLDLRIENPVPGGDAAAGLKLDSISGIPSAASAPEAAAVEAPASEAELPAATVEEASAEEELAPPEPAPEPEAEVEEAPAPVSLTEPVYEATDFAAGSPVGAAVTPELTPEAQKLHAIEHVQRLDAAKPGKALEEAAGFEEMIGGPGEKPVGEAGAVVKKPVVVAAAPVAEATVGEAAAEEISPVGGFSVGPDGIQAGTVVEKPVVVATAPVADAPVPAVPGQALEEGVYQFPTPKYVAQEAPAVDQQLPVTAETSPYKPESEMTPEQAGVECKRLWDEVITPQSKIAETSLDLIRSLMLNNERVPADLWTTLDNADETRKAAIEKTLSLEKIYFSGQESKANSQVA